MFITNAANAGKKVNTGKLVKNASYVKVGTLQIQFQLIDKDVIWNFASEAARDTTFTNIGTALAGTAVA